MSKNLRWRTRERIAGALIPKFRRPITNREATQMLYSMYPSPIRRWIAQRGGLTSHMIYLRGKQLARMYKPCYLDAHHYFAVGG
jgi:hypothetical protein